MWQAGLNLSVQTDNRLMSGISLSQELHTLYTQLGFSVDELAQMSAQAARASFLSQAQRDAALLAIEQWQKTS
jgi:adenosine deaminase